MTVSNKGNFGFTIIEILVVAAITVVVAVVVATSLVGRRSQAELDSAKRQITTLLRDAQQRSIGGEGGYAWGVHFENSASGPSFYGLFPSPYSTTSTTAGLYRLPPNVRYATSSVPFGGSLDVVFAPISGLPSASTTIVLELISGGPAETAESVTRDTSGLIFFDNFNRTGL